MAEIARRSQWWRAGVDRLPPPRSLFMAARSPRAAFWGLVVFTLLMILAPQQRLVFLKPLHVVLLVGVFTGAVYVAARISGRAGRPTPSPAVRVAAVLAVWTLLMVPFSLWPMGSLERIFGLFLKALVVFWLLARVVDSVWRLKAVAWTLSLIGVALSIGAVSTLVGGGFQSVNMSYGWSRITGYASGLAANPNDLALMLNLILPFSVALLFVSRRAMLRVVLALAVVLEAAAVVATYSRAGFITLAAVVIAFVAASSKRRRRGIMTGAFVVGLCVLPVVPAGYWHRLGTITSISSDRTGSAQQRWSDMRHAVDYSLAHPVIGAGAGMDNIALNKLRKSPTWERVHNVYLQYAVDLGLPGLGLFALLLLYCFRATRYGRRTSGGDSQTDALRTLSTAVTASLAGFAVAALFYPVAFDFYFFYVAGLAVAVRAIAYRAVGAASGNDISSPARSADVARRAR